MKALSQCIFILVLCQVIALRLPGQVASAQESILRKQAERYFDDEDYQKASPLFSQLLSLNPRDADLNYKYGVCIIYTGAEKSTAVPFLEVASRDPLAEQEVWYYLGRAYLYAGKFEQSKICLERFIRVAPQSKIHKLEAELFKSNAENAMKLSASRKDISIIDVLDANRSNFYERYDFSNTGGKLVPAAEQFLTTQDKDYQQDPVMFISKDAQVIYYASFGKGSLGGKDLYEIRKLANGQWSSPVSLGGRINSNQNEDFPFLDRDGRTLYFSSRGHNSTGGYDIFKSTYDFSSGGWSEPENLGIPLNTTDDDFLFVTNPENNTAMYATSLDALPGKLKVRVIHLGQDGGNFSVITGTYSSLDQITRRDARITVIRSSDHGIVSSVRTDPRTGSYELLLAPGQDYTLVVEGGSYSPHAENFSLPPVANANFRQEVKMNRSGDNEELTMTNFFTALSPSAGLDIAVSDKPTNVVSNTFDHVKPDTSGMMSVKIDNQLIYATSPGSTKDNKADDNSPEALAQNQPLADGSGTDSIAEDIDDSLSSSRSPGYPQIKIKEKDRYNPYLAAAPTQDELRQKREESERSQEIEDEESGKIPEYKVDIDNRELTKIAYNDARELDYEGHELKVQATDAREQAQYKDSLSKALASEAAGLSASDSTLAAELTDRSNNLRDESNSLFEQAAQLDADGDSRLADAGTAMKDAQSLMKDSGTPVAVNTTKVGDKDKTLTDSPYGLPAGQGKTGSGKVSLQAKTQQAENSKVTATPGNNAPDKSAAGIPGFDSGHTENPVEVADKNDVQSPDVIKAPVQDNEPTALNQVSGKINGNDKTDVESREAVVNADYGNKENQSEKKNPASGANTSVALPPLTPEPENQEPGRKYASPGKNSGDNRTEKGTLNNSGGNAENIPADGNASSVNSIAPTGETIAVNTVKNPSGENEPTSDSGRRDHTASVNHSGSELNSGKNPVRVAGAASSPTGQSENIKQEVISKENKLPPSGSSSPEILQQQEKKTGSKYPENQEELRGADNSTAAGQNSGQEEQQVSVSAKNSGDLPQQPQTGTIKRQQESQPEQTVVTNSETANQPAVSTPAERNTTASEPAGGENHDTSKDRSENKSPALNEPLALTKNENHPDNRSQSVTTAENPAVDKTAESTKNTDATTLNPESYKITRESPSVDQNAAKVNSGEQNEAKENKKSESVSATKPVTTGAAEKNETVDLASAAPVTVHETTTSQINSGNSGKGIISAQNDISGTAPGVEKATRGNVEFKSPENSENPSTLTRKQESEKTNDFSDAGNLHPEENQISTAGTEPEKKPTGEVKSQDYIIPVRSAVTQQSNPASKTFQTDQNPANLPEGKEAMSINPDGMVPNQPGNSPGHELAVVQDQNNSNPVPASAEVGQKSSPVQNTDEAKKVPDDIAMNVAAQEEPVSGHSSTETPAAERTGNDQNETSKISESQEKSGLEATPSSSPQKTDYTVAESTQRLSNALGKPLSSASISQNSPENRISPDAAKDDTGVRSPQTQAAGHESSSQIASVTRTGSEKGNNPEYATASPNRATEISNGNTKRETAPITDEGTSGNATKAENTTVDNHSITVHSNENVSGQQPEHDTTDNGISSLPKANTITGQEMSGKPIAMEESHTNNQAGAESTGNTTTISRASESKEAIAVEPVNESARLNYTSYETKTNVSRRLAIQSEQLQERIVNMKNSPEKDSLLQVAKDMNRESMVTWQSAQADLKKANEIQPGIAEVIEKGNDAGKSEQQKKSASGADVKNVNDKNSPASGAVSTSNMEQDVTLSGNLAVSGTRVPSATDRQVSGNDSSSDKSGIVQDHIEGTSGINAPDATLSDTSAKKGTNEAVFSNSSPRDQAENHVTDRSTSGQKISPVNSNATVASIARGTDESSNNKMSSSGDRDNTGATPFSGNASSFNTRESNRELTNTVLLENGERIDTTRPAYPEFVATRKKIETRQQETIDIFVDAVNMNRKALEQKEQQLALMDSARTVSDPDLKQKLESEAENLKAASAKSESVSSEKFASAKSKTGEVKNLTAQLESIRKKLLVQPEPAVLNSGTTAGNNTLADAGLRTGSTATDGVGGQQNMAGFRDLSAFTSDASVSFSSLEMANMSREMFSIHKNRPGSLEKSVPMNPGLPEGLCFKVQIGAFRKPVSDSTFRYFQPVSAETSRPGWIRYCVGLFKTFEPANLVKKELRRLNYKDAFVVAYYNGKRISLHEAFALLTKDGQGLPAAYADASRSELSYLKQLHAISPDIRPYETDADVLSFYSGEKDKVAVFELSKDAVHPESPQVVSQEPSSTVAAQANGTNATAVAGASPSVSTAAGTEYAVQIGVYHFSDLPPVLQKLQPVFTESSGPGLYRFLNGPYADFIRADSAKSVAVIKGVPDAFVVMYRGGRRILLSEHESTANSTGGIKNSGDQPDVKSPVTSPETHPAVTSVTAMAPVAGSGGPVRFRVQIGAFRQQVPYKVVEAFLKLSDKGIEQKTGSNGLHIFYAGNFENYNDANDLKNQVVENGVKDAFIVAFSGDNKITVSEAFELLRH